MRPAGTVRGVPLLSLGLVLGGWVLLRAAMWETPFEHPPAQPAAAPPMANTVTTPLISAEPAPSPAARPAAPDWLRAPLPQRVEPPRYDEPVASDPPLVRGPVGRGGLRNADRMIAEAMMLAAGYLPGTEVPSATPYRSGVGPVAPGVVYAPEAARRFDDEAPGRRWSLDLWALWREDTTTVLTSGRPSYGRSQVGAVLRYQLEPSSGHAPQLYLRATRALEGARETDIAGGVSARPLPGIPVRLAAEARVSETDRGTELRAAAFAVSELPPLALPAGLTAEAYVQGGYVTGEFETPFVDGQARITRRLAGTDDFRLSAGGAAWGGAQDDARRLDIGPSAALEFDLGETRGRLSADYRFRVAGDAEPASGPALTLTAGF